MRAVGLLVAALLLAGCASSPRLDRLSGNGALPEPYFEVYRDDVGAQYERAFDVGIDERATGLLATLNLSVKTSGLLAAPASPAKLTLQLYSPEDDLMQEASADAEHPTAMLDVREFTRNGLHKLVVTGNGATADVAGTTYGAAYELSVEILYS